MAKNAPKVKQPARRSSVGALAKGWKLEDAKARFSEVVRRAQSDGPQYVTVRGKPSVAIIDVNELDRLLPPQPPALPFLEFMESLQMDGLDLTREDDTGRDVEL